MLLSNNTKEYCAPHIGTVTYRALGFNLRPVTVCFYWQFFQLNLTLRQTDLRYLFYFKRLCSFFFFFPSAQPSFLLHTLLLRAAAAPHSSTLLGSILTFLLFAAFLVSQYQVQWVTVIGLLSVAQAQALPLFKADLISCTLPLWG